MCFEQRICSDMIDSSRGIANQIDNEYFHRIKLDQQVKNSKLDIKFVATLLNEMDFDTSLTKPMASQLIAKTFRLWDEFILCAKLKGVYIHRKDSQCFVVAIVFSLESGISSTNGAVVFPHPGMSIKKLNKKKEYKAFKVSNIRDGQRQIMSVFEGHAVKNPILLL